MDTNAQTPLQLAASEGHGFRVRLLLEHGAMVECKATTYGALALAVKGGHNLAAQTLLGFKADVNSISNVGRSPIHYAAAQGDVSMIEVLINAGAAVNIKDRNSATAATLAAIGGDSNPVECLLKRGAQPNSKDSSDQTALHYATRLRFTSIVDPLLVYGADLNLKYTKDGEVWTPVMLAVENGHIGVLQRLLKAGAFAEARGEFRTQPIHRASRKGFHHALELRLKHGANILSRSPSGWTALHLAVIDAWNSQDRSDATEVARILLDHGAAVEAEGTLEGWRPLHFAAMNGYREAASLLLNAGAIVDPLTRWRENPLHLTARRAYDGIADLLSSNGASPRTPSDLGWTPLHIAAAYRRLDIVSNFLLRGADLEARSKPIVKWINLKDVAKKGYHLELNHSAAGVRALQLAIMCDAASIAKTLMVRGAKVDVEAGDGWRPVHSAAYTGQPEIVRTLIKPGAYVHVVNKAGQTPLEVGFSPSEPRVSDEKRWQVHELLKRADEMQPADIAEEFSNLLNNFSFGGR